TLFPRSAESKRLLGRPRHQDESAYLLVGFARCASCGGPVGTELRSHGSRGARHHVPHYSCLDHRRAGASLCANRVGLRPALPAERSRLMRLLTGADVDAGSIKADLRAKVRDITALLSRHTPQARQMLRKLLADKIELEPVGSGRQRGYRFKGELTVDRLIEG